MDRLSELAGMWELSFPDVAAFPCGEGSVMLPAVAPQRDVGMI
jgi:hypothetical protein